MKVHDITTNKPLNMQSWQDVHEVVGKALEEKGAPIVGARFWGEASVRQMPRENRSPILAPSAEITRFALFATESLECRSLSLMKR